MELCLLRSFVCSRWFRNELLSVSAHTVFKTCNGWISGLQTNSKWFISFFRCIHLSSTLADWSWRGLPRLQGDFLVYCNWLLSASHLRADGGWWSLDWHRHRFPGGPECEIRSKGHCNIRGVIPLHCDSWRKHRCQQQHQVDCCQWVNIDVDIEIICLVQTFQHCRQ